MDRWTAAFVAACALTCVILWPHHGSALAAETVHLAAFDYPPFYYQENGETRGIAAELVIELFSRMNMPVDIKMYPLKRALNYLEIGRKDGIMILIKTPERQEYAEYTDPVMTVRGLIWSASNRPDGRVNFERLEDLRAYRIGVTRGYSYGTEFDELLKNMNVNVANSDLSNFRMLLSHRIDVFPCNEIVAGGLFKQYPELAERAVPSSKSFIEWDLYMGISKKSPLIHRMPEINGIIAEMKREGFVDSVVSKYVHE
jgi:polar amino acid transport system substrate-binding protein